MLLVHVIIGVMLYFVMRAMGELLLTRREYRSFADVTGDLLGPWAAFFAGWTDWFCWVVTARGARPWAAPDRCAACPSRARPDVDRKSVV